MALRVGAPGDGEPHEIHCRRDLAPVRLRSEHDGADLAGADPAGDVEGDRECLAGVLERRDVRQQRAGVDVDGVAPGRLQDGDAGGLQALAEVGGGADPVPEIVVVYRLLEPLGDRLQVAPGEPAVGGEAFGEDLEVAALIRELVVVHRQPAADVRERILLRAHRHPVGE